jgi:hypothetical protein
MYKRLRQVESQIWLNTFEVMKILGKIEVWRYQTAIRWLSSSQWLWRCRYIRVHVLQVWTIGQIDKFEKLLGYNWGFLGYGDTINYFYATKAEHGKTK